jgi:hypothetical protein
MSDAIAVPEAVVVSEAVTVSKKIYMCKICKKPGHVSSNTSFHPKATTEPDVDELSNLFNSLDAKLSRSGSEDDSNFRLSV